MSRPDRDLQQRVNEFVATRTGVKLGEIRPESRLFHDLGICGDDAALLVNEFARNFEVDLSGFEFARFFRGEPHLLKLWKFQNSTADDLLPLTLGDLYRWASEKRFVL
jgi:hypothetical protein